MSEQTSEENETKENSQSDAVNPLEDKFGGDVTKMTEAFQQAETKITQLSQELSELKKGKQDSEDSQEKKEDKPDKETEKESTDDKTEQHEAVVKFNETGEIPDIAPSDEGYEEVVRELYGDGITEVVMNAGVDVFDCWRNFVADGKLTQEQYDKFAAAGFNQEAVDAYYQGFVSSNDPTSEVDTVVNSVGGKEVFREVMQWFIEKHPDQHSVYNSVLETGNVPAITAYMKDVKEQYIKANGNDPAIAINPLPGEQNTTQNLETYKSVYEMQKDMSDPRYSQDPAFQQKVREKLSNYRKIHGKSLT